MELEDTHFQPDKEHGRYVAGGHEQETEEERLDRLNPERAVLRKTVGMLWDRLKPDGVRIILEARRFDPDNPEKREDDKIYRALYGRLAEYKAEQKKKK